MFECDIKRAFTSVSFYTIIAIAFIAVTYEIFDSMFAAWFVVKAPWGRMGMDSMIAFTYLLRFTLIAFFYPLLCVLPFGTSLSDEASSGIIRMVVYRSGRNRYLKVRLLSVALSGGVACAISVALIALFSLIAFPLSYDNNPDTVTALRHLSAMFANLNSYTVNTFFAFSLWQILMCFIGGCIWSVVSLGISVWFPNRYFAMVAPVVIYCACVMLAVIANGKAQFLFPVILFGDFKDIGQLWEQILFRLAWLSLGCMSYYFGGKRLMKNV